MLHLDEKDIEKIKKYNQEKEAATVEYHSRVFAAFFQRAQAKGKETAYLDKNGKLLPEHREIISDLIKSEDIKEEKRLHIYYANQLKTKNYSKEVIEAADKILENFKKFLNEEEGNKTYSRYLDSNGDLKEDDKLFLREKVEKYLDGKGERPLYITEAIGTIFMLGAKDLEPQQERKCRL